MRLIIYLGFLQAVLGADILMVTMGGTKSHKIPFLELAKGLIQRGHKITFLSGFSTDMEIKGLTEIHPPALVEYIREYTNWDLLGARMRNEMPLSFWDSMRYAFESCDAVLGDSETKLLYNQTFNLAIIDGTFPECILGLIHRYQIPFMYINTVGFFTHSLRLAGTPSNFAITPNFYSTFTDDMNFIQRGLNTLLHLGTDIMHSFVMNIVHRVIRLHLGDSIPHPYEISKNVSFILQNGHFSVSYTRALNPNVAEIACIHCKKAEPLPLELENFISQAGELGFIYVSMGSSVKPAKMPESLRHMFLSAFAKLPYQILWKYDAPFANITQVPSNVKVKRWLPQQDILGHKKLRAFITHGGLLSLFESVYHGVPLVSIPVFCDHDVNSAKAEQDGFAIKLELKMLTARLLYKSIIKVIDDPQYKKNARLRQNIFRDQQASPLENSIYWTEYVLRHKGAHHLQSPARNLNWIQYYLLDWVLLLFALILLAVYFIKNVFPHTRKFDTSYAEKQTVVK